MPPDRSDTEIVAALRRGDQRVFAELVDEYSPGLMRMARMYVRDRAVVEEVVQETWIAVLRGIDRFEGRSSLKTWIYRIAVHEASNRRRWWFRHKAKETSIEPETETSGASESAIQIALTDHADSPFDSVAHHEVQRRVEEELRKVPEPYRTTLILRDLEEMSYEEIAEVLEVSLGTVKSRLTRGRDALRQRLVPYVREVGRELGLTAPEERNSRSQVAGGGRRAEVTR